MSYVLAAKAAGTLIRVGPVDGVEICGQTDLAGAHLRGDRTDRSMGADVYGQSPFSGPDPQPEKVPAVLGRVPVLVPFGFHALPNR